MLKTTSKTGKDAFSIRFDDLDHNCLSELSSDEASEITGGFTLTNNTESTRGFVVLGQFTSPESEVLQPGDSNSYNGDEIFYSSSLDTYEPALSQQLGPTDSVSFRQTANRGVFIGSSGVFAPKS
ncbi:hypothetical protein [Nostoc sp.]|uniref:hypothetical protein n=1 Tax=Nostoc sp. TaxID=1180 RepID=UPI002FF85E24